MFFLSFTEISLITKFDLKLLKIVIFKIFHLKKKCFSYFLNSFCTSNARVELNKRLVVENAICQNIFITFIIKHFIQIAPERFPLLANIWMFEWDEVIKTWIESIISVRKCRVWQACFDIKYRQNGTQICLPWSRDVLEWLKYLSCH